MSTIQNEINGRLTNTATAHGLICQTNTGTEETAEERRVSRLQRAIETLTGDIWYVTYDIPTVFNKQAPNPSKLFWSCGAFRLNWSNWCMSDAVLNSLPIQEELAKWAAIPPVFETVTIEGVDYQVSTGIVVRKVKYAEDQKDEIRKIAREELRKELIRVHQSLVARIIAADTNLKAAQDAWAARVEQGGEAATEDEQETAANRRRNAARNALRDATNDFAGALHALEVFDDTEELTVLLDGVRRSIRAAASAFNARVAAEGFQLFDDSAI